MGQRGPEAAVPALPRGTQGLQKSLGVRDTLRLRPPSSAGAPTLCRHPPAPPIAPAMRLIRICSIVDLPSVSKDAAVTEPIWNRHNAGSLCFGSEKATPHPIRNLANLEEERLQLGGDASMSAHAMKELATVQPALTAIRETIDEYGPEWVGAATKSSPNRARSSAAAGHATSVFRAPHAPLVRLLDARGSDETLHERLHARAWPALLQPALRGPELFALLARAFHGAETFRSY
jgi:hypothetical protein